MYSSRTPTPIQKAGVPIALTGRDLMACAQTGSGKTGAFMLTICVQLMREYMRIKNGEGKSNRRKTDPMAIVLTPTRELAIQILKEAKKFSYQLPLKACIAYGGQPRGQQLREIQGGCDILIATPGRLSDFLTSRNFGAGSVKVLVLDEADRMLDMGFAREMNTIITQRGMPRERQTLMFSATFPREIQQMATQYLNDAAMVTIGRVGSATDLITQQVIQIDDYRKRDLILDLIRTHNTAKRILIFVERKTTAGDLDRYLEEEGFYAMSIHGDKQQHERETALNEFTRGAVKVLVATDVASRGLDVDGIDLVINYDTPNDIDSYTHRIGRTGRAGRKGLAISFINHGTNKRMLLEVQKCLAEVKQSSEVLDTVCDLAGGSYGGSRGRGGGGRGRGGGGGYGGGFGGGGGGFGGRGGGI